MAQNIPQGVPRSEPERHRRKIGYPDRRLPS